jgi:hypothetical protein
MLCREGFQADGTIDLISASIGSQLDFSGAHLDGKDGRALTAQGLTVTESMFCREGFQAAGQIYLSGASIGGQLDFSGAHLDGKDGPALTARGLTVTESMLCYVGFQADGTVDLAGAKIGTLVDEKESWPSLLNLDGLTYGNLTDLPARDRLDWLSGQPVTRRNHMSSSLGTTSGSATTSRPVVYCSPSSASARGSDPGGRAGGDGSKTPSPGTGMRRAVPSCCSPARSSLVGWSSALVTRSPWARARTQPSTPPCTPSTC